MLPSTRARLAVVAAAVLFSTGGAAIKATTLTSWQVAGFRSGIAAAAVLLLVPASRRGWSWRTPVVGIAYAATLLLFVLANKLTTSANAIFLQSTAPLYLLLLGPLLLQEPIRRRDLGFMLAIGAGLACFFVGTEPPVRTAPDPVKGNLLALASSVTWAFTLLGLRWLGRAGGEDDGGSGSIAAVVAGNVIAFGVALPFALPVLQATPADWFTLAYLGVIQIGLAYVLLTRGMSRVPAFEASILLLCEPVLNPVWSWLVHGEQPGAWALLGGAAILGATLSKTWLDTRAGGEPDAVRVTGAVHPAGGEE
jgi:drug/metabolite transporter (DMT)-like permease